MRTTPGLVALIITVVGHGCSNGSNVPLESEEENRPPRAVAGPDSAVAIGTILELDGSGSVDADGDPLAYRWQQVEGPPFTGLPRTIGTSAIESFLVEEQGFYTFHLTVTDTTGAADTDGILITAPLPNRFPNAVAGPDQIVRVGEIVTLDASGSSDPDGDSLRFFWSFSSWPSDPPPTIDGPDRSVVHFTPVLPGSYEIVLQVADPHGFSNSDALIISVTN